MAGVAVTLGTLLAATLEPAAAGVAATPHNLVGSGRATVSGDEDSTEVCAFCHTPHGEDRARPLWQASLADEDGGFVTYDSFGRSNLADVEEMGSVSLACMACHDGVQALNVTLSGPVRRPLSPGARDGSMLIPESAGSYSDTSVSHPVGIPYGVWRDRLLPTVLDAGAQRRGLRAPDADEQLNAGFREPLSATIDGATVWWLETGSEGRQRGDIHLYTRPVNDAEAPFVECASCHDPHAERPNFLRRTGTGSLCQSCHAM